jgi:hypothetical protein
MSKATELASMLEQRTLAVRAATELRRLDSVNKALLDALKSHVALHDSDCTCADCAAIKQAEGE